MKADPFAAANALALILAASLFMLGALVWLLWVCSIDEDEIEFDEADEWQPTDAEIAQAVADWQASQ